METQEAQPKTLTIRIPTFKLPSLQSWTLILLIVVGLLQTAQLLALDQKLAKAASPTNASNTSSSSDTSGTSSSTTSSLPGMVGGC